MPIGMTAALEAAANYAGLTTADVADADVDPELDETPAHYEVELEVPGHGELEYRVDAYTGQVLSGPANVKLSAPVNPSGDIGMEAAKSAALKHAGLSEGQVQELQVEWDNEHGRAVYEVEFKSGGMEYEYVIDAATGSVLEHQADQDD